MRKHLSSFQSKIAGTMRLPGSPRASLPDCSAAPGIRAEQNIQFFLDTQAADIKKDSLFRADSVALAKSRVRSLRIECRDIHPTGKVARPVDTELFHPGTHHGIQNDRHRAVSING